MESKKIDEHTIEVTTEVPAKAVVKKYDYNFLIAQKKSIQDDLDRFTAARQAELAEVNALITECEKLGIKPKEPDVEIA
jgi:hypothetical protein